jgi:hypothetical protein
VLPEPLATAIRTNDVRHLRLYANDLLLTEVNLQLYPGAVQGNLFKRASPDLALHRLNLSLVRVVLRAEPPCGPPVVVATNNEQGPPQEFLVEEWGGLITALTVVDDSISLAVSRVVPVA